MVAGVTVGLAESNAYRLVYDSRHLQADCKEPTGISSGTLRSAIEYGLAFLTILWYGSCRIKLRKDKSRLTTELPSA